MSMYSNEVFLSAREAISAQRRIYELQLCLYSRRREDARFPRRQRGQCTAPGLTKRPRNPRFTSCRRGCDWLCGCVYSSEEMTSIFAGL